MRLLRDPSDNMAQGLAPGIIFPTARADELCLCTAHKMQAQVRLLRCNGVLLDPSGAPERWHDGLLESEHTNSGGCRRLTIRPLTSGPGVAVIASLYQPSIVRVDQDTLRLRGLESVTREDGKVAGVVQEWLVKLRHQAPLPHGQAYYLAQRGETPAG